MKKNFNYPKNEKEKKKKKPKKKARSKGKDENDENKDAEIKENQNKINKIEITEKQQKGIEICIISENEIKETINSIEFEDFFEEIKEENIGDGENKENSNEEVDEKKEKDKIINKQFNPYVINTNLNNNDNPFINTRNTENKINIEKEPSSFTESSSNNSEKNKNNIEDFNQKNIDLKKNDNINQNENSYINKDYLIMYNKLYDNNNEILGYINLTYNGKNFYLMTKKKDINKVKFWYYYCRNHDTSKSSLDGKRHSICNAKIKYDKQNDLYEFVSDHSTKCKELNKVILENITIINKEITNKEHYREILLNILNCNPLILFSDFMKRSSEIYRNNDYNFDLKKNFIKNLYYNWKKDNIIFTKFSVFKSYKTLDNELFMRDFTSTYIYKTKNSEQLIKHEHIIFISPFQIRKILSSLHLYIDCTFIYPKDFKQLLVILYYDEEIEKRAPGCYILLNNKTENGYKLALTNFKKIVTLDNTRDLALISYSTDYEKALYNALEDIFPNIRRLGCYFHYSYNLRKKLKEYNIIKMENNEIGEGFLNDLLSIPFRIQSNENIIDEIFLKYEKNTNIENFKKYFYNQWEDPIKSGILNYAYASIQQRSNSFIENYNRRIKTELCKYI